MIKREDLIKWCYDNGVKWKGNMYKTTGKSACSRDRYAVLVKMRDKYTCRLCGEKRIDLKKRDLINIKHPTYSNIKQLKNVTKHDLDIMYILCHSCNLFLNT